MDFGKLNDISKVDFSLPPDHAMLQQVLGGKKAEKTEIWVGCPVWANENWCGKLYPPKTSNKDFLYYYSRQFNCIELNVTHYRIPEPRTIDRWHADTPKGFQFCPKISQHISHELLLENAQLPTRYFTETLLRLEDRLGLCFLQLPPHFSPAYSERLIRYLQNFPKEMPLSVEFRHADWFSGHFLPEVERVFGEMQHLGIGTVITDVSGRRDVLHQCLTNSTAAIRWVGNDLHESDYTRLNEWVERLKVWFASGLEKLYFWVHEPDNTQAPDAALFLIEELNRRAKLNLRKPILETPKPQNSLF